MLTFLVCALIIWAIVVWIVLPIGVIVYVAFVHPAYEDLRDAARWLVKRL